MSIVIVTDSNCGFTVDQAKELGFEIQPTPVLINGEQYFEEEGFTQEQFYEALTHDGTTVATSQPNPYDVAERWRRLLKTYDEILYMPLSSGLSETALTIKKMAETEPEFIGKVYALDNHRVSITQKQTVCDAMKMIAEGKTAKEIYDYFMETGKYSSIYIALGTLKFLKKSGRLTPAAALIGTMLKIKPVLQNHGGVFDQYAKVRKMSDAKRVMTEALANDLNGEFKELRAQGKMTIGVAHTQNFEEAKIFAEELQAAFPDCELRFIDPLSLSVSCHIGPGALACGCCIKY
ncbi:MAG: DegV family protein [Clostridia bacterium]|nr:DegV family protein [Clostridia bacterium]